MKKLPKIPDSVIESISWWVGGGMSRLSSGALEDIKQFYTSLKIKHNSNVELYRGIRLSYKGFNKLMTTGIVELKKRKAEGWSHDIDVANEFMSTRGSEYGIILGMKIPKNKIIVDIQKLHDTYRHLFNKNDSRISSMAETILVGLGGLRSEMEVIVEPICTKCTIDNVIKMNFRYDNYLDIGSHINTMPMMKSFANMEKISKQLKRFIDDDMFSELIPTRIIMLKIGNSWKFNMK